MSSEDSEYGDTRPLEERLKDTVTIERRQYQKHCIENNIYFEPIDEVELQRLDHLHEVLDVAFHGKSVFPPVSNPRNILDCGTGSCSWINATAEQFPDCHFHGIDISPHVFPADLPDNVDVELDDLNERFNFDPNTFDLVHSRLVAAGIHKDRWESYVRDIFRVTKPGGWAQMVEFYPNAQSHSGSLTPDHALSKWSKVYLQAMEKTKDPRVGMQLRRMMHESGFVSIEDRFIQIPMCPWPNNPHERAIGQKAKDVIHEFLSSSSMYPLREFMDMSVENIEALVKEAQQEALDVTLKPYFALYVCIGQKPGGK